MKGRFFSFGALCAAAALVAALIAWPDLALASTPSTADIAHGAGLFQDFLTASPALLALRAKLQDLTEQAERKIEEAGSGDLEPDAARALEGEHKALIDQATGVRQQIAAEEARIAQAPSIEPNVSDLVAAERARAAEIVDLGTRAGLAREDIDTAVRQGTAVDAFRTRAFDHMASQAAGRMTSPIRGGNQDETETRRAAMTAALAYRIGGVAGMRENDEGREVPVRTLTEPQRAYARHALVEMASEVLGERSMPRTAADREDVFRRAFHTTTDFPVIFEAAINTVLRARYALAQPTYRRIAQQRSFMDFRPHNVVRAGDFPMLQPVNQAGEIKFGTFGESKETIALAPYGIQFALTRQMLVNDNLGAIDQVLGSQGDMIARFEEITFYAMKAANSGAGPTLIEGSAPVFATARGNLAGTGGAISTTTLSAARAAMRKFTAPDRKDKLNVTARTLLVGPDKETEAETVMASITPRNPSDVNVFSGKFEILVSGEVVGNAWELYADPSQVPVFQWGLLDGYTAPRLRIENPFGTSGVGISLEHDFGCGAIDWRGAYRNPGA